MAIGLAHATHLNTWLRHIKERRRTKKRKAPQGESHHIYLPEANMTLNVDNDYFFKLIWKILEIMSDPILSFIPYNLLS